MSNEPEKPIEKLLRACARKRREEARDASGFELHPATRRLLQGEVARRLGRPEQARSAAPRRWAGALWPRLVEGCVLVTLVTVVAYLLIPALRHPRAEADLAKNEAARPALAPVPSTPAPAAAPPSAPAKQAPNPLADRAREPLPETASRPKEAPAMPSPGNRNEAATENFAKRTGDAALGGTDAPATTLAQRNLRRSLAASNTPATPAEPPIVADNTLKAAQAEKKLETRTADQARVFQRFQQVPPAAIAGGAPENKEGRSILVSFEVEQRGRELRVIDSDGSVYTGLVQAAQAPESARASESLDAPNAARSAPLQRQSLFGTEPPGAAGLKLFFQVSGTNRSLNQPVVFSGNLSGLTNSAASGKQQGYFSGTGGAGQPPTNAPLKARISGQARIGQDKVIEVNAVPTP